MDIWSGLTAWLRPIDIRQLHACQSQGLDAEGLLFLAKDMAAQNLWDMAN